MQSVLVTGGAGFIGSHVAEWLVKAGYRVVVLDDLSGGFPENVPEGAEFVRGSVQDAATVDALFEREKFSYVFHLAAYAAEGLSHFIKNFNYSNNLVGSVNLINAAVNSGTVKCFVFTSSIAVYGRNQTPMVEELEPRPEDPYGISKYAVELDLRETKEMFGLDYVIFRPHNVYGERQNIGDPYRNVIGIFMRQILTGQPLTIFGDGEQVRAFSYIDDVAPVIAKCIERPETWNQVYNIGADKPWTVNELATTVCRAMGAESSAIRHLDARNEVVTAYSCHDKVKRVFGDLIRNVQLEEGIGKMAAWVKTLKNVPEPRRFGHIEVPKNLPPSWAKLS
ncbi:MAG: NAD-dependent epimerase/dehydratase family protein [Kiritimatiellae bacterium]|nr:NAD-dependent epimerase/dehydratase family protein [Kiritimatiellia bacterium]